MLQHRDYHFIYLIWKKMTLSVMIDIETLATNVDATIVTIAAQCFDPFSKGYIDKHFYARVTLESQEDRRIDDNTITWWASQPEASAEAFAEEGRISLEDALDGLHKLCWKCDLIWTNGPAFDISILEHASKSRGKPVAWQYFKVRDARTVYGLWPDCPKPPTSHHALEDCKRQIDMLQSTLAHLNITKMR
jgi:hypothetical protein